MKEIITKYLEGTATESEMMELLQWIRVKKNRKEFFFHRFGWKDGLDKNSFPGDGEETWNKIQSRLLEKSFTGWQKSRKIQQFLRYAAIFFFLTTLGSLIWVFTIGLKIPEELMTRVIADNGQISKVLLPDSSLVWLNSGSTITYGNHFSEESRELQLVGEAYFEVSKNEKCPLIVNCNGLQVKVKGTKFNVSAFPGKDKISVILEKGAVELLRENNSSFPYILKPGELAEFDISNKKMAVSKINTYKYTSWKEGIIHIYDQTLDELAERLKTRYNQEFVISDEVKHYHYTFTIKNEPLQEIIGLIEKITPVKAVQNGAVITFKPDNKKIRRMDNKKG
jgi:transmembrane sensor